MAINSISPLKTQQINPGIAPTRITENKPGAEETPQVKERRDTLELSGEVQQQQQQVRDASRTESLQQIQTQISSGFYNQPDIIRETAARISRDLQAGLA